MTAIYLLGPFRLDAEAMILFRGAESMALGHRAVALLRVLVERPAIVVSKDSLVGLSRQSGHYPCWVIWSARCQTEKIVAN
jgi:hypothetical protein